MIHGTQDTHYSRSNSQPGTPQQHRANASPSPLTSATGLEFSIGSMVIVRSTYGPLMYGVVKWLGQLPNLDGNFAGVELVSKYMYK